MPPRLPCGGSAVSTLESALSSSSLPSTHICSRTFTSTPVSHGSTHRRWQMHQWLKGRGRRHWGADAPQMGPRLTGPMDDQPFPLNPAFRSQPVLSESVREAIYDKVMMEGQALKAVSQEFGVDVRRVGAVVRLMEVEKEMVTSEKQLATPYADVINSYLPQTRLAEEGQRQHQHEAINEITVHPSTQKQLFVPVSESRHFTREDAAKAFSDHLLSADDRSFQKELIDAKRQVASGEKGRSVAMAEWRDTVQTAEARYARDLEKQRLWEQKRTRVVEGPRAEVRIRDFQADKVGKDGKKAGTVGWRYGVPHMDRKRGAIKIPTEVPSRRTAPLQ